MRPYPTSGLLGFVIGAAIGALIGLALIKLVSPWCIPIGAVAGGVIGFAIGNSGNRPRQVYSDDNGSDLVDEAATGCMLLGCLTDGLSCFGVLTLLFVGLGFGILMSLR